MPQKNKKACQAKAQHTQGGKIFKKGFFDNLDIQNDPDWVTEDRSDSNSKFGANDGWAMNIAEEKMPNLSSVSILGDEDLEDNNDDFFAVDNGIKRKAAIDNEQSTEDSSDEKGYKEVAAHKIVSKAEAFWKDKFSKVSHHK